MLFHLYKWNLQKFLKLKKKKSDSGLDLFSFFLIFKIIYLFIYF